LILIALGVVVTALAYYGSDRSASRASTGSIWR
jgi:hypothetical protein